MTDAIREEIDRDYATALADRANRYMVQHGVTPTPSNLAVWFTLGFAQALHRVPYLGEAQSSMMFDVCNFGGAR
jgi:hypothetical protein